MSYNPPGGYGSPASNYQRPPPGGQQGYAASPQTYGRPQQQQMYGGAPPPGQGYASPVQQNQGYPPQNYGKRVWEMLYMNLKRILKLSGIQ